MLFDEEMAGRPRAGRLIEADRLPVHRQHGKSGERYSAGSEPVADFLQQGAANSPAMPGRQDIEGVDFLAFGMGEAHDLPGGSRHKHDVVAGQCSLPLRHPFGRVDGPVFGLAHERQIGLAMRYQVDRSDRAGPVPRRESYLKVFAADHGAER